MASNLLDDINEQGALVAGERNASRYGEPRSVGVVAEGSGRPEVQRKRASRL